MEEVQLNRLMKFLAIGQTDQQVQFHKVLHQQQWQFYVYVTPIFPFLAIS